MSPLILHRWGAGPPWCRQYQRKYVYFYLKPILFCNLAPSFLYLPTLLPGAQIYLPITASLTITSTTLTPNVTGRTTGEARYLRVVVSQILAV